MKKVNLTNEKIIPIWQPRYWDKKVLIATYYFTEPVIFFHFCVDRNFKELYYVETNAVINNCSIASNGKIDCYEIPYEYVHTFEGIIPDNIRDIIFKQKNVEREKYNRKSYRKI